MKKILMSLFGLLALALAAEVVVAQVESEKLTEMKKALSFLEKARDVDMGAAKTENVGSALAALKKAPADKCGHRVAAIKHTDLATLHIKANNAKSTKMAIDDAIKRVNLAINCKQ